MAVEPNKITSVDGDGNALLSGSESQHSVIADSLIVAAVGSQEALFGQLRGFCIAVAAP